MSFSFFMFDKNHLTDVVKTFVNHDFIYYCEVPTQIKINVLKLNTKENLGNRRDLRFFL